MTRTLTLAIALSLTAFAASPALASSTAKAVAGTPASPAWVEKSNEYAQILLDAQAPFQPEQMSFFGVPGYDDQVADFRPEFGSASATPPRRPARAQAKLAAERDPNVRQDLEIMIRAADEAIEASELNERLTLPWLDAPQIVFHGMQGPAVRPDPAGAPRTRT